LSTYWSVNKRCRWSVSGYLNFDRLRRVDVRRTHEVTRRVGADRNHREIKGPEVLADLFLNLMIMRNDDEINLWHLRKTKRRLRIARPDAELIVKGILGKVRIGQVVDAMVLH